MDVVLNNSAFPGKTSQLSEVKSGAKEGNADLSRSSSASKVEALTLPFSSQAQDTVELVSQTKSVEETRKPEEKKQDQEKAVGNSKEKNIIVNETLLQYRIEESEDEETGETSKELVVYLMDKKTGEVIRQIPPENIYDQSNKDKLPSSGIFVDQEG